MEGNPSETGSVEEEESSLSSLADNSSLAAADQSSDDDDDDRQPLVHNDFDNGASAPARQGPSPLVMQPGESGPDSLEVAALNATESFQHTSPTEAGITDDDKSRRSDQPSTGPSPVLAARQQLPPLLIQHSSLPSVVDHSCRKEAAYGAGSCSEETAAPSSPQQPSVERGTGNAASSPTTFLASPEFATVTLRRASPVTSPARNRSVRSDFISSLVDQQQQQQQQHSFGQQQLQNNSFPLQLDVLSSPGGGQDIGLPPLPKSSPPKFTGKAGKRQGPVGRV